MPQIFVETDSDVRLARRLKRDITQRGRDIHGVMQQYENHVKPAYDRYIAPTMQHADIIVPRWQIPRALASGLLWIRIRLGFVFKSYVDPDPYSEYGSGSTRVNIGETQMSKNFFRWHFVIIVFSKNSVFKRKNLSLQIFLIFSFKLKLYLGSGLNWAKILEPWIRIQIQCFWIHNTGYQGDICLPLCYRGDISLATSYSVGVGP